MAARKVKVRLVSGEVVSFAVGNSLCKEHREMFVLSEVAGHLRRKLARYLEGVWDMRPVQDADTGEERFEWQRVTVPQFETAGGEQVAKDIKGMTSEFFEAFRALCNESLKWAEVEEPTRKRLLDEVIGRADIDNIMAAVVDGRSNVAEEPVATTPVETPKLSEAIPNVPAVPKPAPQAVKVG